MSVRDSVVPLSSQSNGALIAFDPPSPLASPLSGLLLQENTFEDTGSSMAPNLPVLDRYCYCQLPCSTPDWDRGFEPIKGGGKKQENGVFDPGWVALKCCQGPQGAVEPGSERGGQKDRGVWFVSWPLCIRARRWFLTFNRTLAAVECRCDGAEWGQCCASGPGRDHFSICPCLLSPLVWPGWTILFTYLKRAIGINTSGYLH